MPIATRMTQMRFYLPETLALQQEVHLKDEKAHRLRNVMRAKLHQTVRLFNGDGNVYQARVIALNRREVTLIIEQQQPAVAPSPLYTHLLQAISRTDRMDYALQKATELGVNRITPVITDYVQRHHLARHAHWLGILISSAEQCGRGEIPVLDEALPLVNALEASASEILRLIFLPEGKYRLHEIAPPKFPVQLLIGNEGGFSDAETKAAEAAGFQTVRLGPRILRTETAASVALAGLQMQWGDV